MTFKHLGRDITLCIDAPPCPSSASAHQLKRLLQAQSISALFHITTIPAQPALSSPLTSPIPTPSAISSVLSHYPDIFTEPTQLPPPYNIQHHIHLLPHTPPINVKPYRYPHFQKGQNRKTNCRHARGRFDSTKPEPLLLTNLVGQEEGWHMALLRRLSGAERRHCERSFSDANHRRTTWWFRTSFLVLQARFAPGIRSDKNGWVWHSKNRISNTSGALRIHLTMIPW